MRKEVFVNEGVYHILNRGVDKRNVFLCKSDYERFMLGVKLLNDVQFGLMIGWRDFSKSKPEVTLSEFLKLSFRKPLVEIIAFCVNPNHYHFILRQIENRGITQFMHRLGTSYTKFFNKKYDRSGSLFEGSFKAVCVESNEYLLYLSAYVNKNHSIHGLEGDNWKYSSFIEYCGRESEELCCKNLVLDQFNNRGEYRQFANNNARFMKEKKEYKKYLME